MRVCGYMIEDEPGALGDGDPANELIICALRPEPETIERAITLAAEIDAGGLTIHAHAAVYHASIIAQGKALFGGGQTYDYREPNVRGKSELVCTDARWELSRKTLTIECDCQWHDTPLTVRSIPISTAKYMREHGWWGKPSVGSLIWYDKQLCIYRGTRRLSAERPAPRQLQWADVVQPVGVDSQPYDATTAEPWTVSCVAPEWGARTASQVESRRRRLERALWGENGP